MFEHRAMAFGLSAAAVTATALLVWVVPALGRPAASTATTVNVVAGKPSEYRFTLSKKSVPVGTVTFKISDKGTTPHDFEICASNKAGTATSCKGESAPSVSPGGTATLKVTFKKPGTNEYLCTLPGHAGLGMKGNLKVT